MTHSAKQTTVVHTDKIHIRWMDGCIDGWVGNWIDGWTDRQKDRANSPIIIPDPYADTAPTRT
jgi:hypothetical protein